MKRYYLASFGCQMNEHDSEIVAGLLTQAGYRAAEHSSEADLIVVNTCSVRAKAYQKAISEIGRHGGGSSPGKRPIVAVTGCVASQEGAALQRRFPFVDIVLGPDHLQRLPSLVADADSPKGPVALTDFEDLSDYEFPMPISLSGVRRVKAYVTVMKGCDNVCSFCIVPYVRGPEVSRPAGQILSEIRRLEGEGVREIILLGQNVNSYGRNLAEGITFAGLLRRIDEETAIPRVRFTSPHPKDLSDELIGEYGRNGRLCPHLHLPVQSGSNRILRRMRRAYTREVILRKIRKVREVRPDVAVTTDLIVGFPGETEEDFEATLRLVEEVGFDSSYLFAYSPRPHTEAAGWKDDVPPEVKRTRLARLQALQSSVSLKKNRACVGRVEEVLIEGPSANGAGQLTGRTAHGRIVNLHGDEKWIGVIMKAKVRAASPFSLQGEVQDDD